MALFIGSAIARGNILDISESEAAFHPWWDQVQDYITYSLILIGLFALPTANTQMECTLADEKDSSKVSSTYVNKFCTTEVMSLYISYFPYILILGPIILVTIEKYFTRTTAGEMKARQFYRLIVKATTKEEEEMDDLSRQNTYLYLQTEFMNSRIFVLSYVMKNVMEFLVALGFVLWLIIQNFNTILNCSMSSIDSCELIYYKTCMLRELNYSCIMPNVQFYFNILIFGIILLLVYLCCNFYTFLWLLIKPFRKLSCLIQNYAKQAKNQEKEKWLGINRPRVVLASLKSPDVDLLLDLIAEKMGVEVALKILVLLDPAFGKDWKINISNSGQIHATSDSIEINFATPVISTYLDKKYSKKLVYEVSIESVEDDDKAELKNVRKRSHFSNANATKILDDIEARPQSNGFDQDHNLTIFTATFNDLDPGREYKIDVSTNYNGQEVAKSVSKIVKTLSDGNNSNPIDPSMFE